MWSSYVDFRLDLDANDAPMSEQLVKRLTLDRLKAHKPSVILLAGDSGEGKSMSSTRICEIIEPNIDMNNQVIYTPYEYPKKMRWILFNKEAAGHHVLFMAEARELIKSKLWFSLINQSIADVNAMSRAVKPLVFILNTQDISDIDKENRRLLTYYGYCIRPLYEKTRLHFYKINKSKHNIQNPKLMLKKLRGYVRKDGVMKRIEVNKMIMNLPSPAIKKSFDDNDFKAKQDIILKKLDVLETVLNKDKPQMSKVEEIVEFMTKEPSILQKFMTRKKDGSADIKKDLQKVYNMNGEDFDKFKEMMIGRLQSTGLMVKEEE